MIIPKDRVKQYTSTAGSGIITFSRSFNGYQTFANAFSSGDSTYYCIENRGAWEVGLGTYGVSGPDTFSRDTLLASSTGSKLALSGGSTVFCTLPASKILVNEITSPVSGEVLLYDGTKWINSSTAGYTNEQAQDAVASMIVPTGNITTSYNDAANVFTISGTGLLARANNLSDLVSVSVARSNLGLGTAALSNSGDFYLSTNPSGYITASAVGSGYQPLDGDLSSLSAATGVNTIYYRSATNTWSPVVIGTGISFSGGTLSNTLDLSSYATSSGVAASYVPYTGATGSVNLGSQSFSAGAITASGQLINALGTITTNTPVTFTQTWNSGATTFTGLRVNVTDTASASSSLLADFQIAGTSVCALSKGGSIDLPNDGWIGESSGSRVYFPNVNNLVLITGNAGHLKCRSNVVGIAQSMPFVWGDNTDWTYSNGAITYDLALWRDTANSLAQRNSTNAQTFNIANTWTSTTSFEYGRFQWASNEWRLGTAVGSAGGTQRDTVLGTWNSAGTWSPRITVKTTGSFLQGGIDIGDTAYYDNTVALSVKSNRTWLFNMYDASVQLKFALTQSGTLSVYNIMSNSNSYESLQVLWSSNEARIGTAVGSAGGTSRLLAVGYWNTAGTWKSLITWDANDFVTFPVAITKHGTNTSTADAYIGNTQVSQISDGAGYSIASNGYTAPGSTSPITGFTTRTGYGQSSRTASVFSAFHGTTDANSYWEWRRAAAASTSTTRIAYLDFGGNFTLSQQAAASGSPTAFTLTGAAHTTLTASTEATDVNVNLARTVQFATGALTTQRAFRIQAPTYAFAAASTITTASTLAISGPPIAGANATITNAYALNVESGLSNFGGGVRAVDAITLFSSIHGTSSLTMVSGTLQVSGHLATVGSTVSFGNGWASVSGGQTSGVILTAHAGGTGGITLSTGGSNTCEVRNSTSAQTFRVYNTYTSSTSHEYIKFSWATNVAEIGTVKGSGGGSARDLVIKTDDTTRMTFGASGTATVNTAFVAGSTALMNAGSQAFTTGYHIISWNGGCYGWSSGGTVTTSSTADTAIKRSSAGVVEVNNGTSGTYADLIVRNLRMSAPTTVPATAASSGSEGQIAWDANYIYICTATNTWKRVAIDTWVTP